MTQDKGQVPEALRLAGMIERYNAGVMSQKIAEDYIEAAAELRRQHTRIADLEARLASIRAGGVPPLVGRPQAMPDLSALTERGAKAWTGVDAQGFRDGVSSVPSAAVALSDDLRDRLVAISEAVADQDDRAAQAMLREILKAPQPSPTAQADSAPRQRQLLAQADPVSGSLVGYFSDEKPPFATHPSPKADSVLEDAARLDFLIEQRAYVVSDPDACPGHWLHWARPDGSTWVQGDEHPTPRAAIDAARKQGANHD